MYICKRCNICSKDFKDNYALQRHLSSHDNKTDKCTKCGQEFKDLESHVKKCGKRKMSRQYVCDICNKKYLCKRYLHVHIKNKHQGVIFSRVIVARRIPINVCWKDIKRFTHINCDYTIQANFFNCYVLPQVVIFLCIAIMWSSQFNCFMLEDRTEFDLLFCLFYTYYFTVLALLSAILKHR